jgi:hypothetical protein
MAGVLGDLGEERLLLRAADGDRAALGQRGPEPVELGAAELMGGFHPFAAAAPQRRRVERHAVLAAAGEDLARSGVHLPSVASPDAACRLESRALDRDTSSSKKRAATARTAGEEADHMLSEAPERLTLPPPYRQHRLDAGDGSVLDAAVARVSEGAGTLVWTDRPGLLAMAVVLEPETPLAEARRAFHLGMAAVCEALAAFCAPERDVRIGWPDTILHDTSRLGGGRLRWPADCGEGEVPAWLVFGAELIRDRDGLTGAGALSGVDLAGRGGLRGAAPADRELREPPDARVRHLGGGRISPRGGPLPATAGRGSGHRVPDRPERRSAGAGRGGSRGAPGAFAGAGGLRLGRPGDGEAAAVSAPLRLPRTIRLDPSDTVVFAQAAEPGEWAVAGTFLFAGRDVAALSRKEQIAFRSGFVGLGGLGFSTLVVVSEARKANGGGRRGAARASRARLGAPDLATARPAAEEEIAYAAGLCEGHAVNTLIALHREQAPDGTIRERFRTLRPRAQTSLGAGNLRGHDKAFFIVESEGEDAQEEKVDLVGLLKGKGR